MPMNQLRMYKDGPYIRRDDHSDVVYRSCLSIPCSTNLKEEEAGRVVEAIKTLF